MGKLNLEFFIIRHLFFYFISKFEKKDINISIPRELFNLSKGESFLIITLDEVGSVESLKNSIETVLENDEVKGLMIFACDSNGYTPERVDHILNGVRIPLFGGIFPEIIFNDRKLEKGTIIAGITKEPKIGIIPNLSQEELIFDKIIDEEMGDPGESKTMFVLVDGFSKRINDLIDSIFNNFGLEFNYIGGGAGSLSMVQKPCLFTNHGLIVDSAVLASFEIESGVGVSHGWKKIKGPFKITESEKNVVKTINWEPAFPFYKKIIEEHSGKTLTIKNFFDISKSYPFGIKKLGAEDIVRDPIMAREDNTIICVGDVQEGSFVDVLSGDNHTLIRAARDAFVKAKEAFGPVNEFKTAIFLDCISRVLFLEKNFGEEINAVYTEGVPLIGALTIGEIANSGNDCLEFYNKTSVVGVMDD